MTEEYFTVEQISKLLDIHPKTIQRYIREGKLKAAKLGKSWRVTGHDLSVFVEGSRTEAPGLKIQSDVKSTASAVVDIQIGDKEAAVRIMNTLTAALNSKPLEYGPSSLQTQYSEHENLVRVMLWGNLPFMTGMMAMISTLTEPVIEE